MIDRKMRKNEKEGVMQRENECIIYHLMHFNEKDKEWSERPYLLLEDMAIVFDILDLDDRSIQRIDHKKANKEQWSDQFLWESAKKNTKQLLPAKFEPVYKDFRGHTEDRPVFVVSNKIQRYGAGVICYEDFLSDISRKYNKSLYLLPTSIHEMLLLFDDGEDQEEDLLHILEKSDQQLSKEEFLSDNIYYYDKYMEELISLF